MSYHIFNWCCDKFEHNPDVSLGTEQEVMRYWSKHDKVVGTYEDFEIFLTWQLRRFGLKTGDVYERNKQAS